MHVALAFAGMGQGVHDPPHVAVEPLAAHTAPHAWKPALHVNPHAPFVHVASPFAGAGQGVHAVPHDVTASLGRH